MDMTAAGFGPQGFRIVEALLDDTACDAVAAQIDEMPLTGAGSRQLLQYEWCRRLALSVRMHSEIRERLPADSVGVQCTLFNKSPSANWLVALHQDRSIPVRGKVDSLVLKGWSEK